MGSESLSVSPSVIFGAHDASIVRKGGLFVLNRSPSSEISSAAITALTIA